MKLRSFLLLVGAIASGLVIGWIDTGPHWDDTGITVGAIVVVSTLLGALAPSRPWFPGLVLGVCIGAIELGAGSHEGSVVALVVALAGSLLGGFLHRTFIRPPGA